MPATILHIISGLKIGGAETALLRLLEYGLTQEYDCHVLSLAGKGPLSTAMEGSGAILHYPAENSFMRWPSIGYAVVRVINKIDPAIVQGWMYHGNISALAGCKLSRKSPRLLWNIRAGLHNLSSAKWLTRRIIDLGGRLSKKPNMVLYNSEASLKLHVARGYYAAKNLVIPNGFDTDLFKPSLEKRRDVRSELNVPAEATLVTHLGRFHPDKGQVDFAKAASRCLQSFPNTFFLMAGPGVENASSLLGAELTDGDKKQFRIVGARTDSEAVLAASDIYVSSSRTESFPNTLGEAMASELACIATDVGDCALLLKDCGQIVPKQNVDALASAIEGFVSGVELTSEVGSSARKRIKEDYSIQTMVSSYIELYEAILVDGSTNQCVD